jgi:hypothetical protein
MTSSDLSIVWPPSTRHVRLFRSSTPCLLLLPQFSSLHVMPLLRPTAHSSSDRAPRARPSCGPRQKSAQRPAHAPGRNLGLGRERLIPPGLKLDPVSVSRPSKSDGCARFPAEQNCARRPRANPSLILFSSAPSRASQRRLRATERRRRDRARGAARAPHRCARSPLGERATVEWPQQRFYRRAAAPSRSGADP